MDVKLMIRDVPDIQLNRISGQDLGILFNRISGIRYITISGIIRYPKSGRISIPVLSGTKNWIHWIHISYLRPSEMCEST